MFIICRMRTLIFNIKFWFTNFTFYATDRHKPNCSESARKGNWWKLRLFSSVLWHSSVFSVDTDFWDELLPPFSGLKWVQWRFVEVMSERCMEICDLDRGKRREYRAHSGPMGAVDSENENWSSTRRRKMLRLVPRLLDPDDRCTTISRNFGNYLPVRMVQYPRIL